MYYYKYIDTDGSLVTIQELEEKSDIEDPRYIEITKEEYDYLDEHVNGYVPM